MTPFAELWERAARRKGEAELEARLPAVASAEELAALGDDRYLSMMARCVFQAGFVYRVVEAKWAGFEESFREFDPEALASWGPEDVELLAEDARIVRNPQKIRATVANARYVCAVAAEHGSFAGYLAAWPTTDIVGLWAALAKGGARLGGATGPRVLRRMGKDTFILTPDVVTALVAQGIVAKQPTAKRDLATVQAAFNRWAEESGRSLGAISVTLACTVESAAHAPKRR